MTDQQNTKKQLIEELAELQQVAEWRSLVADMPVFVAMVNRAGTIQYLNHPTPG
jgi:hypothetical protein